MISRFPKMMEIHEIYIVLTTVSKVPLMHLKNISGVSWLSRENSEIDTQPLWGPKTLGKSMRTQDYFTVIEYVPC